MITTKNKTKIMQIVNVFETGNPQGKYDSITILPDGKNNTLQITYGRSQTTEQGNLKALIELYIKKGGVYSAELTVYLAKIGVTPLTGDEKFKKLLKSAGGDPIMINAQDEFFDTVYYEPALHFFNGYQFTLPLSLLVIYDSYIHSGSVPDFLRNKFSESPPSKGEDEKKWIEAYVKARHYWLATNKKKVLQKTIYRTQCFLDQIKSENWDLVKPVTVLGITIV